MNTYGFLNSRNNLHNQELLPISHARYSLLSVISQHLLGLPPIAFEQTLPTNRKEERLALEQVSFN